MKIILRVLLLLVLIAISFGGCYLLLPVYSKPVAQYLAAQADDDYAAGRYRQAVLDLTQACQLQPANAFMLNNLAWILCTCPDADQRDGKKAVVVATKACELSKWNEAANIDTLAAAYAETGDFDNAIKYETQYLGSLSLSTSDAADGEARLALYKAHQPYHADK